MNNEKYYNRLKEIIRPCLKWTINTNKTKGGDVVYKSLHFGSIINLKDFLNNNNVTPDRIIGIYPVYVAPGVMDYEILFISKKED